MKFEVIFCDTLLPKTRHVTRRQTISEKKERFLLQDGTLWGSVFIGVNKVVKF
ncbi:hypothetical protein BN1180_02522 [Peribacillus simplex]|uniref:Uncharacterized protein n=1 Tax=Peribacillus simplex TaxID=1478 RepID=A0AAN2PHB6_9BACI|nr:hypothetical protein BN1180_02522 [Peribacillus simplex]